MVFLVQTEKASSQWDITPLIGAASAAVGNEIVTTVTISYAVSYYRSNASSVGVFMIVMPQTWRCPFGDLYSVALCCFGICSWIGILIR